MDAFAAWFTGSKIVDAAGQPKMLFHATTERFKTFRVTNDIGFHFGSEETACSRACFLYDVYSAITDDGIPVRMIAVYLRVLNPLRVGDLGGSWEERILDELQHREVISPAEAAAVEEVTRRSIRSLLRKKGHDGLVYSNVAEGGGDSYLAFDSGQIWMAK